VYAGVAISGFLMFGESTMSQFTLNLPQQYIPSKIAIWMTVRGKTTLYHSAIAFRMKTTRC
jgi:solute carrier family 32 (vesicular inhibitory amino acid transporter)